MSLLTFSRLAATKVAEEEVVEETVKMDLSTLSQTQLIAIFKQNSPEFDGIVLDFKVVIALHFFYP